MNRCLKPPHAWLATLSLVLAAAGSLLCTTAATAQMPQRIPPIPSSAEAGMLVVTEPPVVVLNGQPHRLSPGARIRGRNNLIVMPSTLVGSVLPVRYVQDVQGLLHEVWILDESELPRRAPPPVTGP